MCQRPDAYQCWCGVNYVEQLRFVYAREVVILLTLKF